MCTQGALSFIHYQDVDNAVDPSTRGFTPVHIAAQNGHVTVTDQLIAARCNVDLQTNDGRTPRYIAV